MWIFFTGKNGKKSPDYVWKLHFLNFVLVYKDPDKDPDPVKIFRIRNPDYNETLDPDMHQNCMDPLNRIQVR